MKDAFDSRFTCPVCGRAPDVERLDTACFPNGMLRPGRYVCRLGHPWELTPFDLQFSPSTRQALRELSERL